MQILPGIYLVNGSPYGRHQNGYLVKREGACILIDSGDLEDGETLAEVERNAVLWGIRLSEVTHMLVTHAHFDHASHAAALQRRGIKIVSSQATAEAMAVGDERCIGFAVQRTFEPSQVDVVLGDGEELVVGNLRIRCILAPGHTEGVAVFEILLDGQRLWLTGDLFEAQHAHRWVSLPWTGAPDFDRAKYIQSLARLLALPACDHVLPGHGPAAISRGKRLLEMAYTEALTKWR